MSRRIRVNLIARLRRGRDWISGDDCDAIADALEAAEATIANLEHQLQQADELATAAYKDAETAEAKLAAIRDHCQDNIKTRTVGDYENGYDAACLDILDIMEAQ